MPALAALVLFALPLGLAACGDSGDETASAERTSSALTKAEFLKKANAICRKGQKEIGRLNGLAWEKYGPPGPNPSQATLNKVALAMLPPKEVEVRLLRALRPPKKDAAYIDEMLTAWEEGIQKGKEEPAALLGSVNAEWVFQKSYDMGMEYGLSDCWLS